MVMRSVLAIVLGLLAQAAVAEVEVSIDRNPVQINESFQLVFSLDHDPDLDPDFSILQQHFQILGSNRSNSISIINGQYQRSVKFTLQMMAKQVGDYIVPAIRFGQQRSKPLPITVNPSTVVNLPQDELIFEVIARQSEIFVQSQVIVKLRLLSASNISAYQFGDIVLQNIDAVIEPLGDVQDYQTRIADRNYLVLEQRFALFPLQSGQLKIPPILAEVRLPSNSTFDPFRSGGEIKRLHSKPVTIEVKPIPSEADGAFWLPAKKLILREELPDKLDGLLAGEPLTRSLSIVAEGLTAAQLPEIEVPPIDGIKQYPDQPGLHDRRSGNGITGMRTQKIAIIPGSPGVYHLPEISLRWWNLQTGQLETATIPARELRVGGVAMANAAPPEPAVESTSIPVENTSHSIWLWISLMLALGWGLNGLYWRYRSRSSSLSTQAEIDIAPLRRARKSLQKACVADDAAGARTALLIWGRALLAPGTVRNLQQLEHFFGSEFSAEMMRLNQSLYADRQAAWQGAELWRLCQMLESEHRALAESAESELSPLIP